MSQILKANDASKILKEFEKKEDTEKFNYRLDKSFPSFVSRITTVLPNVKRQTDGEQTLKFEIPKEGLMGKMMLKIELDNFAGITQRDAAALLVCKEIRLMSQEGVVEMLNPDIIFQKIFENQNTSERDRLETMMVFDTSTTPFPSGYVPLLFTMGSDINHLLDTYHLQKMWIEVDLNSYSIPFLIAGTGKQWQFKLLSEYFDISKEVYDNVKSQYPKSYSWKSYVAEKPYEITATGSNKIKLKQKGLIAKSYVMIRNNTYNYQLINGINIDSGPNKIYQANTIHENVFFNKSYLGAEIIANGTSNIWTIPYSINCDNNGYTGGIYLDGENDDIFINVNANATGTLYIYHEFYNIVHVYKNGLMKLKPQ